jgi:hypothetical protein
VNLVKTHVPDALYTDYSQIHIALKEAIAHPPKVTTIPKSIFEPYKHAPLSKKLGIKPNTTLVLIHPPKDFTKTLRELPRSIRIQKHLSEKSDLVILFAETSIDLQNRITEIIDKLSPNGKLWIAWRKKVSETTTNVTQPRYEKLVSPLVLWTIKYAVSTQHGLDYSSLDANPNKPNALSVKSAT